jgi:hypothetical protein
MSFVEGDTIIKLALGRGKTAKGRFSLVPLQDVVEQLRNIDKDISLKYQAKALKKAAKPGLDALRQQVGKIGSVTGNLAASVARRDRKYTNNRRGIPVSVEVIGFRRPTGVGSQRTAKPAFAGGSVLKGPNRAYHSHLVEFGTTGRRTPGKSRSVKRRRVILDGKIVTRRDRIKERPEKNPRGILSSLKTRGPFFAGGRGLYPFDFIATGSVAPMPALKPLQKAFTQSRSAMQSILDREMRNALAKAIREVQKRRGDEFPYS